VLWLLNWLINLQVLKGLDFFLNFWWGLCVYKGFVSFAFRHSFFKIGLTQYVLSLLTFLTKYSCWSKFVRKNFFTKKCGHYLRTYSWEKHWSLNIPFRLLLLFKLYLQTISFSVTNVPCTFKNIKKNFFADSPVCCLILS